MAYCASIGDTNCCAWYGCACAASARSFFSASSERASLPRLHAPSRASPVTDSVIPSLRIESSSACAVFIQPLEKQAPGHGSRASRAPPGQPKPLLRPCAWIDASTFLVSRAGQRDDAASALRYISRRHLLV